MRSINLIYGLLHNNFQPHVHIIKYSTCIQKIVPYFLNKHSSKNYHLKLYFTNNNCQTGSKKCCVKIAIKKYYLQISKEQHFQFQVRISVLMHNKWQFINSLILHVLKDQIKRSTSEEKYPSKLVSTLTLVQLLW